MNWTRSDWRACPAAGVACWLAASLTWGGDPATSTNGYRIDLPTVLRLVGARNLDLEIARAKLAEARAHHQSAQWQFLPWIAPGLAYRAHNQAIQNVEGRILDVQRDSYTLGPALVAQVDVGDAIYRALAARQLVRAAEYAVEAQRQDAVATAAVGYFELARAQASIAVAAEARRVAEDYTRQWERAVEAGLAFRGDALRARTQLDRNQLAHRQAQEQQQLAATRLGHVLHLDPTVELIALDTDFLPITLVTTNAAIERLVSQALASRPELPQAEALVEAARKVKDGARYGPLVPSVGAQVFVGGIAGGNPLDYRGLSDSEDYQVTLTWRLGPGGLFDPSRVRAADARYAGAQLASERARQETIRQVVEAVTRTRSEADKLALVQGGLASAEEAFRLAVARKDYAVGLALETIQAEQEWTRLRQDYVNAIAEYDKSQYLLVRALGGPEAGVTPEAAIPPAVGP